MVEKILYLYFIEEGKNEERKTEKYANNTIHIDSSVNFCFNFQTTDLPFIKLIQMGSLETSVSSK